MKSHDKYLLDTNVVLRLLLGEPEELAKDASLLFSHCDRGEIALVLEPYIVAEVVYALEKFYGHNRKDIADKLLELMTSPGILSSQKPILLNALNLFRKKNVDFSDCLLASHSDIKGIKIATFDKDFKKLPVSGLLWNKK